MKQRRSVIVAILAFSGFILLCLVLGAALLLLAALFQSRPSSVSSSLPTSPQPTTTPYKVSRWASYRLPQYGFSFDYPSTWKVRIDDKKQPDPTVDEHQELNIILITDVFNENSGKLGQCGVEFIIYPNPQKLTLDQLVRKIFGDTDNLLVFSRPSIKVGNAKNVLFVKDDSAYLQKTNQVFPISQQEYFIETPTAVWRYILLSQNPTSDMKPLEAQFLGRMVFPQ